MTVVIKNLEFYDMPGSIVSGTARQRKRLFILTTGSATATTDTVYLPTYDAAVSTVDLVWANTNTNANATFTPTFGSGSVQAGTNVPSTYMGIVTLT